MKYFLIILFCFALIAGGGAVWSVDHDQHTRGVTDPSGAESCIEPIYWRFGKIDPRFGIGKPAIKRLMNEVGTLWSDAVQKKVLVYSDSGAVELNFIYSEAQKFTESEREMAERMNSMKLYYYTMNMDYEKASGRHSKLTTRYNKTLSEYQTKVKEYNITRSWWSSGGVVTGIQHEHLQNLREQVEELKSRMDRQLKELNTVAEQMNQLSKRLNSYADEVNEIVYRYNERFGEERTFHQGFYVNDNTQQKINIFQFNNPDKLRLVLAHEVGHALGLRHVSNPESVMYYKMERQNSKTLQLTPQDIEAVGERCDE